MRKRLPVALAASALMLSAPLAAMADPTPGPINDARFSTSTSGKISSDFKVGVLNGDQTVKAIIEMSNDPVAVVQSKTPSKLTPAQKGSITKKVKDAQSGLVQQVKAKGGRVEAQMASAYNGVKVEVKRKDLAALATVPGVVAIHPVVTYTTGNATSVPFLGAPSVWQSTGYTGQGVKVAVIDTGIDYTHATFNGPGTVEAYNTAKANGAQPADPSMYGPNARVKGGIDLVGDDYNANVAGSVPKPDSNPLDCNGHGSHVAGTIGGGGVTEDGKAYTGPYNEQTATMSWKVGPGVAPQVDLYAVRVFGCAGSTDVTTEAIDWAVANDMDVINMSLGSTYGMSDDPSAVAASNAAAGGVVVVASAGNSGPNPYMAGSPGNAKGVISVAAMDSTASFPGATVTPASGAPFNAINANGATLPTTPFTVVVLKDDPTTTENEALGCSVEAYTKNGISADAASPQLAVTTRGVCARVARGVFGQQAGAAAVLMINTDAGYPPYEGPISENPDTGEQYTVTIPLLGVPSTQGAAVKALEGTTVTLAATELESPSFRKAAGFSSGGPGTGDAVLKPNVTAPGVSIVSAAVGSGNGPATLSGTSMAAPHTAGVAALAVQAHPKWSAQDITNLVVSSADSSGLKDYRLTLEGNGLVDLNQSVRGQTTLTGDTWTSDGKTYREPSLSFGFRELNASGFAGTKTVILANKGDVAQTYQLSSVATPQSAKATVTVSPRSVTVAPNSQVSVKVSFTVQQRDVPSSTAKADDPHNFVEVSGQIVATSKTETVAIPYLMVPRSNANVKVATSGKLNKRQGPITATITNPNTAITGNADFYTLGLTDPSGESTMGGIDLKAAGVQSLPQADGDQVLVFAVNSYSRYSNPAAVEYDVVIDTNGDGNPDKVLISVDSGLVRNDDPNGITEVFLLDVASGGLSAVGALASAPTDSSTVLLPVLASDLGVTSANPSFRYSVSSFSLIDSSATDSFDGWAMYNPWNKPINDGAFLPVKPNATVRTDLTVNEGAYAQQKPLGVLVVVQDNGIATEGVQLIGQNPAATATGGR